VARFGVKIYFGVPERNEYFHIVDALAQKSGLHLPDEQLFDLAAKWELTHLGPSGRSARQLIDHLLGQATAHSNL
jgi:predicted AAA+ superfamily ATPase